MRRASGAVHGAGPPRARRLPQRPAPPRARPRRSFFFICSFSTFFSTFARTLILGHLQGDRERGLLFISSCLSTYRVLLPKFPTSHLQGLRKLKKNRNEKKRMRQPSLISSVALQSQLCRHWRDLEAYVARPNPHLSAASYPKRNPSYEQHICIFSKLSTDCSNL